MTRIDAGYRSLACAIIIRAVRAVQECVTGLMKRWKADSHDHDAGYCDRAKYFLRLDRDVLPK